MTDLPFRLDPLAVGLDRPAELFALAWYLTLSVVTLLTYAADKRRAALGHWRVPNRTLHLLALLGGWPGAILAQEALRHKTRQPAFRAVTLVAALLHLALWGTLSWFT